MKMNLTQHRFSIPGVLFAILLTLLSLPVAGQIPPPGYERQKRLMEEREKIGRLERDSITVIDTAEVFNPETYESTVTIIQSRYSLGDYCKNFLGISNPDMLLDGNPHTIIDPRTYEDLVIRLNPAGKIDTLPR